MLTITKEQMAVLREPGVEVFVKKMIVHLNKYFADKCKEMGEPKLRDFVKYGIQRAASHKISAERDVAGYIDIMTVLGRDFDADQQYPWAAKILEDTKSPDTRVSVLRRMASTELRNQGKNPSKTSTRRA